VSASGDHGSKYRVEVIGPGRLDWFSEPQSCFQERLPHLWRRSTFRLRQVPVVHPRRSDYELIEDGGRVRRSGFLAISNARAITAAAFVVRL
jgi:hypothetical protein